MRQTWVAALWVCGSFLISTEARAEIKMTVQSLLGEETNSRNWSSYVLRVQSTEKVPVKGVVRIRCEANQHPGQSETPITVLPESTVAVNIPFHKHELWHTRAEFVNDQGEIVVSENLPTHGQQELLLFDLHTPSRLLGTLRGAEIHTRYTIERYRSSSPSSLSIGAAIQDPVSGDLILPQRSAEWGSATVVLAPSDQLAKISAQDQDALAGYVLGGGTLTVVIKRPEDLHQGFLPLLLGGSARESDPVVSERLRKSLAASTGLETLTFYEGGNLRKSDFGSSAPYGLGEVHLLPFDPSLLNTMENPWVQNLLKEIVRHAWDRRFFITASKGVILPSQELSEIREQLDPNASGGWILLTATLLLLLYSVVAGPFNFIFASRSGKPLRAPLLLPVFSGLTFLGITLLAVSSKGVRGEARRLSLIEAAGGMGKGTIRRYRGFFSSAAQRTSIQASSDRGLLTLLSNDSAEIVHVDRNSVELRQVSILPWKTLVIREDDLLSIQGGVSLVPSQGDVRVVNRLGRSLRGVVIQVPDRGLYHLKGIQDGESVLATSGEFLTDSGISTVTWGSESIRTLSVELFSTQLDTDSKGLAKSWGAFLSISQGFPMDWWPEGQPVLIAQVDGGEGVTHDQGLPIVQDRTLIRVVGFGGAQ